MGLFDLKGPSEKRLRGLRGRNLKCLVCGGDRFNERAAQLNTRGAELFGLAWANRTAKCHVCADCGYIHWFLE